MGGERKGVGVKIPPAVVAIEAMVATHGAMEIPSIAAGLRAQGFRIAEDRLPNIIERFVDLFDLDSRGQVILTTRSEVTLAKVVPDPSSDHEGQWWRDEVAHEPIEMDSVVVLDIETTGLDHRQDQITEIAVAGMDGALRWKWCSGDDRPPLNEALLELSTVLGDAKAVVGHSIQRFDIPFLIGVAARAKVKWQDPALVLDVHQLSLLVDPALDGRTLGSLCDRFGVEYTDTDRAQVNARATAAVARAMVEHIDVSQPSWSLVLKILARAGLGWDRLLPVGPLAELPTALDARNDALVQAGARTERLPVRQAVTEGLARYGHGNSGYRDRPMQAEMAESVGDVLDGGGHLLVEAPTGTGKTLAYLIPSAWCGASAGTPVVIATHTKVLQRQLRSDATVLRELGLLEAPFRQIQGVNNYLCPRNIAETIEARDPHTNWFAVAVAVRALAETENGVWDDVTDGLVTRQDLRYRRQRSQLRPTSGSCDHQGCDYVAQCPLYKRLEGIEQHAGVVATNHSLLAQWAKRVQEGGTAPGKMFTERPTALVVDEAHNLENSLTEAWATRVGGIALNLLRAAVFGRHGLANDARRLARHGRIDRAHVEQLDELDTELGAVTVRLGRAAADYLHDFGGEGTSAELRPVIVRSRPLFQDLARATTGVVGILRRLQATLITVASPAEDRSPPGKFRRRSSGLVEDIGELVEALEAMRELEASHAFLHQISCPNLADGADPIEEWEFSRLPVEIAPHYQKYVATLSESIVLTSATLTVKDSFGFIGRRLGLSVADEDEQDGLRDPDSVASTTIRLDSPFDHPQQSAVVLTSHLPLPVPVSQQEFCEELGADQVGFLSLTGGRSLGLFASRARMTEVAEVVRTHHDQLLERGVELLVQGEDSPARIQRRFRSELGTTVFGVRSYWEGFDAPGETLSYLMIEKPPYPHPGDLLARARQRAIQDRGGDSFMDYVVPVTAISLTQGFGRLIRREDDRGVAVIADRRMQQPSAANGVLLSTLPTNQIRFASDREDAWRYAIRFVTGEDPDLTQALLVSPDRVGALLEELRLLPGEEPTAKLERAAFAIFGIEHLREEQLEIMRATLAGKDVLGFLPTGSGKSLTFQLPALLHPDGRPTIVVSPLIALIKDQVDDLRGRRGIRVIAGITGRTSGAERTETMRDLAEGKIRLLYVSPERLVRDPVLRNSIAQQDLGALVVDEAHCVSSWGHDFRPEFRQIATAVKGFRRSPRLALTATATREVETDIETTLALDDPVVVRRPVDRPDLSYWVRGHNRDADRTRELLRLVVHMGDTPGVVYASRRALTEELAWILREAGVPARAFHAGMVPEQREAVQDDFLAGTTQVIVATKAFGMGVNKPDIGWVVHYDLPESLEAYAQEAGRAARSPELHGVCALFFTKQDLARRRKHLTRATDGRDLERARTLLDALGEAPVRSGGHVIDPDALADRLKVETDELNVLIAWLERSGSIERSHDCSMRARVSSGLREPEEPEEKRLFIRIVQQQLRCRIGQSRLIDVEAAAEEAGLEADAFEDLLIEWSLRRLVTFHTTQRRWRVNRIGPFDEQRLRAVVAAWRANERKRLEEMIRYATGSECRRATILKAFGDPEAPCGDGSDPCDVHVDAPPPWHTVPVDAVPDPESLVDVDIVLLQAVNWASRFSRGSYGEKGLKAALCGKESLGEGRPLGRGLLSCPQFGAVRYLRSNEKRLDHSTATLIDQGVIERQQVTGNGRSYQSLAITNLGKELLAGTS